MSIRQCSTACFATRSPGDGGLPSVDRRTDTYTRMHGWMDGWTPRRHIHQSLTCAPPNLSGCPLGPYGSKLPPSAAAKGQGRRRAKDPDPATVRASRPLCQKKKTKRGGDDDTARSAPLA